jgi:hypothetical protein
MGQSGASWVVLVLALFGANFSFISQRPLGVITLAEPKPLALRVVELVLMYFLVGSIGLWLEQRAGQIAPQRWEFYAITGALFFTLAFPGFVYRYLMRREG